MCSHQNLFQNLRACVHTEIWEDAQEAQNLGKRAWVLNVVPTSNTVPTTYYARNRRIPHLPWCVLSRSRILATLSLGASSRLAYLSAWVLNVPTSNTVPTTYYVGNRHIPHLPWCVLPRSRILTALSLGASSKLAYLSWIWVHWVSRPSSSSKSLSIRLSERERQFLSSTMVHGVLRQLCRCWEKAFKIRFCSVLLVVVHLGC
jgi:hypothetical protein